MKKFFSLILSLALCISGVFLFPAYANVPEDSGTFPTDTEQDGVVTSVSSQVIYENAAPLPSAVTEATTSNGAGLFEIPKGNGSLIEDVNDYEVNRQFITIQSKGGNIYYIIIDKDGNKENVYFLNAVDDFDLLSFSEQFPVGVLEAYEELKEEAAANAISNEISDETSDGETTKKTDNKADPEDSPASNNNLYILGGVGALFVGGLVYFKVIKPRKNGGGKSNNQSNAAEEEEEEEESEDEE